MLRIACLSVLIVGSLLLWKAQNVQGQTVSEYSTLALWHDAECDHNLSCSVKGTVNGDYGKRCTLDAGEFKICTSGSGSCTIGGGPTVTCYGTYYEGGVLKTCTARAVNCK